MTSTPVLPYVFSPMPEYLRNIPLSSNRALLSIPANETPAMLLGKLPDMLPPRFDAIPAELRQLPQWINWKYMPPLKGQKKPRKVPVNPKTGGAAAVDNPATWGNIGEAEARCKSDASLGLGFVFTENDSYCGIDLDKCFDPQQKCITEGFVGAIIPRFGSYTELSPSQTGLHIIIKGKLPPGRRKDGSIEMYDAGRYFTFTGRALAGFTDIRECQSELEAYHHEVFSEAAATQEDGAHAPACKGGAFPVSDDVLLEKARTSANGEKFRQLWEGQWQTAGYYSQSEADMALCSMLAFWTGRADWADALFRKSGLYRNKWDERHGDDTYGQLTIKKTFASCKKHYEWVKASNSTSQDHLILAREVILQVGKENLLATDTHVWRWHDTGVWRTIVDREIKQCVQHALEQIGHTVKRGLVDAVADVLKTEIFAKEHEWDRDRDAINFPNGELHWTGAVWELRKHCREHYRTTQIPYAYDSNAECPRFVQFLEEIFQGDADGKDKATLILELLGYTLVSNARLEKFVLLIGPGANGKSVLLDAIRVMVGMDNITAVQPSQFNNRFQRAHLHLKLANLVTEIAEGAEIADAELKAITSGELTTAEHKFGHPFNFRPFSTCWFGSNHLPHTRDFSDALFRRAIVIQFNRVFKEGEDADPYLKDKLMAEMPGIISMALQAFGEVLKRNKFTESTSCKQAKQEWRIEADQVAQFIGELCEVEPGAEIASKDLYQAYTFWADAAGIVRKLNRKNFTGRIMRLGGQTCKGTAGARMIAGIKLKPVSGQVLEARGA